MVLGLCLVAGVLTIQAQGQGASALRVRLEAGEDSYYVGEGIELAVAVTARDQRPRIELPRLNRAEIWTAGTSFRPLSTSGIGNFVTGRNIYLTRLRLVPHQTGPLLVPPVEARLDGQSGKSKALSLRIVPVPLLGRPAEFLGGIGAFSVEASVTPATLRLGQEMTYRITIQGPAAWGSVDRPELSRLKRGPLAPRVNDLPDEVSHEPPRRTWVYRIRPTRAGEAVLPPVSIAAFDPDLERYITRVTQGLSVKVIAAPTLDLRTFHYNAPDTRTSGRILAISIFATYVTTLIVASGLAAVLRNKRQPGGLIGPKLAQRFARRFTRELTARSKAILRRDTAEADARTIIGGLISYAQIGAGRPPGAITPAEAGQIVLDLTGSNKLSNDADALVVRCDRVLFSAPETRDGEQLLSHARELFRALGRTSGMAGGAMIGKTDGATVTDDGRANDHFPPPAKGGARGVSP